MKILDQFPGFFLVAGTFLLATFTASAQMPSGGPVGMNSQMLKLFEKNNSFSAKAEVKVLDSTQKEIVNTPMNFSMLDGNVRVEIDMSQMKNTAMPDGAADQLKAMGMGHVTSIMRQDKKLVYVIYPDAKTLVNVPMPKEEIEAAAKSAKVEKSELGKETLDGHPCVKTKIVITDDSGKAEEAITWNASDMKDFPIQVQTGKQNTSIIHFKQIQLGKPDAKQFEPPAGYTEYKDPQEMMQAMMKKALESSTPAGTKAPEPK
jgi:hypothetical protein